jgi:hypothetical protein
LQTSRDSALKQAGSLLTAARDLLTYANYSTAGIWPLAVVLLTRQALELTLDGYWLGTHPEVAECSMRAQLLCLRQLANEETAESASHLWGSMSSACHHHPYDLSPTASELLRWIEGVEEVRNRLFESPEAIETPVWT